MGCYKNRRKGRRRQYDRVDYKSSSWPITKVTRIPLLNQSYTGRSGSSHVTRRNAHTIHRESVSCHFRTLQQSHKGERDGYKSEMCTSVVDGHKTFDSVATFA